jgi:hypothetical protein
MAATDCNAFTLLFELLDFLNIKKYFCVSLYLFICLHLFNELLFYFKKKYIVKRLPRKCIAYYLNLHVLMQNLIIFFFF